MSLRREVRTCASHCDCSLHPHHPTLLFRHLHFIHQVKNTKTQWTGPQPVKPLFCYLTYGSRTANQTDSLYQTINGLVGNVDWVESLTVVACEFPGSNSFGARRRAASAWLAKETCFPEIVPPVTVLKVVGFIILFQKKGVNNICFLLTMMLLII